MIQFADWLAPSILRASLFLTVAALLVSLFVKLLRFRSPAGEQLAWLLVLVQGVMFVTLTIPVPSKWLPGQTTTSPPMNTNRLSSALKLDTIPVDLDIPKLALGPKSRPLQVFVEAETPIDSTDEIATPAAIGSTLRDRLPSWQMLACMTWFAGLMTVVMAGLARYYSFARQLRTSIPAPAEWIDEWSRMCAAAGVRLTIPLVVVKNLGPALCRLPSGYLLVVPEQMWQTLLAKDRCAIYRHELEHYRRGDLWWVLVARLLASVQWYNPFAWWAAEQFEAQSEFACDGVAAGEDPVQFSELLVQLASGRTRRIFGVQSVAAGGIYDRVQRLLVGRNSTARWRAIVPVAMPVLAICVAGLRLEVVAGSSEQDVESGKLPAKAPAVVAAADDGREKKLAEPAVRAVTDLSEVAANEIAGVVVDTDGKPVADALVDAWTWVSGNETQTDEHGVFRLAGFDGKERPEVRITKDGYTPAYFPQQQVGSKDWTVVLTNQTYIEGIVTGLNGQPAAGAEIRAAFGPVQGDGVQITEVLTVGKVGPDGKYRLYLKPDTYDIQIVAAGQGVKRLSGVVVGQDEAKALSFTLERGVRFEARVVDSETGKPVDGFVLWQWQPPYLVGRSNAEGHIIIEDLVPGAIEFNCGGGKPVDYKGKQTYDQGPFGRWWSEHAMNEWEHKQIDDKETGWQRNFDDLSFDLKLDMKPVQIVVERGVTIEGRVSDPDGNPVAGATVAPARTGSGNSLTGDTRYSVKTNQDGTYLVVLPASKTAQYNLIVHDGEYQEWRNWANGVREPMKTTPGQVFENYDLQLTRPAVVRGRVTMAGKPAANREVRTHAFDKLENRYYDPTTTTDKEGKFELKFVRAGKHYLQVAPFWLSAEQGPKSSRIIELEPGQLLEGQDLVAAPSNKTPSPSATALKFQVRVLDPDGTPVAGASVGNGSQQGAPIYLTSIYSLYAKLIPNFSPPPLLETNAQGLIDLNIASQVQLRQSAAWIYAVDPSGKRAGTVLLNLDDYATADPAAGVQVIDVAVMPVKETVIRLNFAAIPAEAFADKERAMMVSINRDNMAFQRLFAKDEDFALLLPEGEYRIEVYNQFSQSMQSTLKVSSGSASRVEIKLQPSRLGSLMGQPAPEFSRLKPGKVANPTLASLKGKYVILDFWGHWCGPCVASMPNLMQIYDEFKDRGVSVVAVHDDSVNSYDKLQTIMGKLQQEQWKGRELPFPVVLDGGGQSTVEGTEFKVNGATTAAYGITSWPTTLLLDREGRVRGEIASYDLAAARKRLEQLLAEPPTSSDRPQ